MLRSILVPAVFVLSSTAAQASYDHLAVTLAHLFQLPVEQYLQWDNKASESFAKFHLDAISAEKGQPEYIQTGFNPPVFALASTDEGAVFKLKANSLRAYLPQIVASLKSRQSDFRKVWTKVSLLEDLAVIKLNNFSGVIVVDFRGSGATLGHGRTLDTTGWVFNKKMHFGEVDDVLLALVNKYLAEIFAQRGR